MLTNNIIVLDSYFHLTNKSYLTDRLQYDSIRFFDHLVVAFFFGPPGPVFRRYPASLIPQLFSFVFQW